MAANTVTLLVYSGLGVVFFLLSIQLQVMAGWSPTAAGAALLPVTVLMLVLSPTAGSLAQRIGPRWPLTVGPAVLAVGLGSEGLGDTDRLGAVFGDAMGVGAGAVAAGAVAAALLFRPGDAPTEGGRPAAERAR
ncbi:MAG: hypothetical protein ACFCVK_03500 [Acidimicrobiales bacterium]